MGNYVRHRWQEQKPLKDEIERREEAELETGKLTCIPTFLLLYFYLHDYYSLLPHCLIKLKVEIMVFLWEMNVEYQLMDWDYNTINVGLNLNMEIYVRIA